MGVCIMFLLYWLLKFCFGSVSITRIMSLLIMFSPDHPSLQLDWIDDALHRHVSDAFDMALNQIIEFFNHTISGQLPGIQGPFSGPKLITLKTPFEGLHPIAKDKLHDEHVRV